MDATAMISVANSINSDRRTLRRFFSLRLPSWRAKGPSYCRAARRLS